MSAVPITLVGSSTTTPDGQTTFVGVAITQGVGIGGGPIQPPLGLWGPTDPRPGYGLPGGPPGHASQGPGFPTNPIAPGGPPPGPSQGPGFPTNPIAPGGRPPGTWGGGGVGDYIDAGLPQPPPEFPNPPPEGNKPPPPNGGWGYSAEFGWGYFPNPSGGGKPQPGEGGEEQPPA